MMRTVFLHGLGQTARDWDAVLTALPGVRADCPELFAQAGGDILYPQLLSRLEDFCDTVQEPFCLCGLSLGATLALDYAARHPEKPASLVLAAPQYKVPTLLIDIQNSIFRWMPDRAFEEMGLSRQDAIRLTRSMRTLDFTGVLPDIQCPVTILCGEKDRANKKAARTLEKLLPRAKLYMVPGAGHEVNRCAPEAIAAAVRRGGK